MTLAYLAVGVLVALVAAWAMRARGAVPWLSAACIGAVWPMALVMLAIVILDGLGRDLDEDDVDPWGED